MFTADQLNAAHSKVKTGADFPAYMREIKSLGVSHYETYVADGRIDYHGANHFTVHMPGKYDLINIADKPNPDAFKSGLLDHQQGKTDFITFIQMCAQCGIERWEIRMDMMTCTYFDKAGNIILREEIPQ